MMTSGVGSACLRTLFCIISITGQPYNTAEMARLIDAVVEEAKELGIETLPDCEINSLVSTWEAR